MFSYSIWHNMFNKVLNCFYQIVKKDLVEIDLLVENKVLLYFRDHLAVVKSVFVSRLSFDDGRYFSFVLQLDNKRTNAIARRDWYVDGTMSRYVGIFFRFSSAHTYNNDPNSARSEQRLHLDIEVSSVRWLVGNQRKLIWPLKRGFGLRMMTLHHHKRAPFMLRVIMTGFRRHQRIQWRKSWSC